MPIHAHFWDVLGVKIGEIINVLWFYRYRNAITRD